MNIHLFRLFHFSPVPDVLSVSSQFDGTGFVEMPEIRRYSDRRISIVLKFKTFWKDALLFYSENNNQVVMTRCTGDVLEILILGDIPYQMDQSSFV